MHCNYVRYIQLSPFINEAFALRASDAPEEAGTACKSERNSKNIYSEFEQRTPYKPGNAD